MDKLDRAASPDRPRRGSTFAWALWDWAEQPFPTIMTTFIFPVYLAGALGVPKDDVALFIGYAGIAAGIVVALVAPVLGRRADQAGRRKFWLMVNTYGLVALMIAAFFVEPRPEFLLLGLVIYGLGNAVQESAFVSYYAMLKQVAKPEKIGRTSGLAWGLGYAGGILLLLFALVGFALPDEAWFGIPSEDSLPIRAIFLFCGIWTLVFSIPLFVLVKENPRNPNYKKESVIESYRKLWSQLVSLRRQAPETFKFLISSAVYRDGLAGVFAFGAVLGTVVFGFDETSIIFFGIAANVCAGIGAAIGGFLDDRLGSRTTIVASLIGLIIFGSGVFLLADYGQITYWIGGLALTFFVGPAQAASRTFVSRFAPQSRQGEVFGLYQTTGRAASVLSPLLWSISISLAVAFGAPKEGSTIFGIIGLILLLAVGLWLLLRVNPNPKVLDEAE